jgi:ribosome-binding protein aMBF1 (putative translation factor)
MNHKKELHPETQRLITTIAERVKQAREAKHMSQEQLSEALGCSLKYVKRMESGDVHFRLNLLVALYDVLELSLLEGLDLKHHNGLTLYK